MQRQDHCSCQKTDGVYGAHGWHWRPDSEYPQHQAVDVAIERCPRYEAARQRAADQKTAASFQPGADT